ncbi:hypothetical protein, partial [Enterobacter hormaechei]
AHTSIEHSRDWCRSLLILNCQELAAQQPLRPINWCSRLLKMTIVPPAPGLIEQLRHMVQMLVDPFGQFFDGLLLELVTFPELDVQGPGHLVEVPADSSKLPARFPYGVHFFISEDRHPVQRPQSFLYLNSPANM